VIQSEAKRRREAIDEYTKASRPDLASKEEAEFHVLKAYLPHPLSEAELKILFKRPCEAPGPKTPQEHGASDVRHHCRRSRPGRRETSPAIRKGNAVVGAGSSRPATRWTETIYFGPAQDRPYRSSKTINDPRRNHRPIRESLNLAELVPSMCLCSRSVGRNYQARCPFPRSARRRFSVTPKGDF